MIKFNNILKKREKPKSDYTTNELNNMDLNTENIKTILSDSNDIVYQQHYISGNRNRPVTVIFIDGLVNIKTVNDDVLKPLTQEKVLDKAKSSKEIIDFLAHGAIYHASRKVQNRLGDTVEDILSGSVALVFDKEKTAITFDIKGFEKRVISEPATENALKGSKDSFIEVLRVNTSLVRRKIHSPFLRIKEVTIGKQTKTPIAVIYIENVANENIVKDLFNRLKSIGVDGVISPGIIEEQIIDIDRTVFPLVLNTERTDKFCSNILEGRVGMLIDGMPTAYIIPATINMFFQAPEDYSYNYITSSFIRLIRFICAAITVLLPGFYISITTFHQEMIPTLLAISIIRSKEEVPFPTATSIIFMLLAFEVLLEAGTRLPRTIGQAVSIIGALVVGQAAVEAKIISPVVVIIVAMTGMAGFTMPNQDFSNSLRILRLVFAISSTVAGLYGLTLSVLFIFSHLNRIESFGVPYCTPFVSLEGHDIVNDTLIRVPLRRMKKRPEALRTTNKKRRK